ncbi:MAG: two-component regulator propeller domain-containing protein, partial [Dokdonella sp.]
MLAFLLAVLLPFQLAQAGRVPGIERLHFRSFGTAQGLSQATARTIAQDRSGFIWIGTQDGLSRFDGYEFRVYKADRDDPWSLSQNHVWALAADPDGSLWVGTQAGGLDHYDPRLDRFINYRAETGNVHALASNHVTALMIDRDQRLWIANSAGRMQWFDRTAMRLDDLPSGSQSNLRMVRTMLQSTDGRVWLGARDGLYQVQSNGAGLHEIRDQSGSSLDVYALAQAPNGDMWVGVAEDGLYRFDMEGKPLKHYAEAPTAADPGLPDGAVRALLCDSDGGLWIAGNRNGLAWLDPETDAFIRYPHDPSRGHTVAANRLSSLLRGRSGALFVGSWANGFSVHDPRTETFTTIESVAGDPRTLPSRQALSVWGDNDGTLWAGVLEGGGLVHLDMEKGVIARYRHDPQRPDSLSHDFVQFMTRTRDGSLWVATIGGGLNRMRQEGSFEHFRHDPADPKSIAEDSILYVYEDLGGTLWIGTLNQGLDERCKTCEGFIHHPHDSDRVDDPASLGGDAVGAIVETATGDLWLALRSGGLDRYDRSTGRFDHFHADRANPESVGSDAISTLSLDSRGELWIGTQGGGISHLLPGTEHEPKFATFDSKQGLAADAIGAILEDANRKFWISTTSGISRFDPETKSFINFGAHDGTLSTGYWINGATRLPGGLIVFSGLDGITVFDPLKVELAPPPQPIATRLLVQNVPVNLHWRDPQSPLDISLWEGGKVSLSNDQDNITFEFAAFDFSDPESIRYSYRLEGHDTQWIETTASRRFATYTDLASGSYRLRLRVRRDGEDWSDDEFTVAVHVAPSPWASATAYAGYFAVAILLGWLTSISVRSNLRQRRVGQEAIRQSEERLKMALWGSGSELWDLDMQTRQMVRENKL